MEAGSVSELRAAYEDAVRRSATGAVKLDAVEDAWKALVAAIVAADREQQKKA